MLQVWGSWLPSLSWILYASSLLAWVAKYGPTHFGWNLPAIFVFCFLTSNISLVLIWWGFTFLSRHRIVLAWYKRRFLTAWHLSSSVRSFVNYSSSRVLVPSFAKVTLGDLWVSSSRRMASSLKRSLNRVNFVALDSEVLCDHMTEVSSSAHFPLGLPCNLLEMPWRIISFALSTRPLDWGCLTEVKHSFVPICIQNSLNTLLSN